LVELMLEARDEMIRLEINTEENNKIIKNFLMRYCVHELVTDDVDVSSDESCRVCYCVKCGVTQPL
jgi:hypothetical protein